MDVLAAYQKMQQAMIDKDLETMRSLVHKNKTFTHMSGKKQTREQFFGEIMDGTLNYFRSDIHDPQVTVNNDRAGDGEHFRTHTQDESFCFEFNGGGGNGVGKACNGYQGACSRMFGNTVEHPNGGEGYGNENESNRG